MEKDAKDKSRNEEKKVIRKVRFKEEKRGGEKKKKKRKKKKEGRKSYHLLAKLIELDVFVAHQQFHRLNARLRCLQIFSRSLKKR